MPYYPHTRTFLPCCTPGVLELYCTVGESRLLAQLLCKCTNRVKYYRTVSVDHWVWMMYSICRFCMISHLTGTMKFLPLPWALLPRLSNAITILRRLFISFLGGNPYSRYTRCLRTEQTTSPALITMTGRSQVIHVGRKADMEKAQNR